MENQNIEINVSNEDFINAIAASSRYEPLGLFGAGFWADHWTYYLDLINAYLSIYPDGEEYLMFDVKVPYFYSPATVRPRHEKYVLSFTYDYKGKHVRQLDASNEDELKLKSQLDYLNSKSGLMTIDANWQHDLNNNRFLTSSIGKLFLLCTIKFATRDAYGMGIEYEAGRPGWNDAMNGLPGMVGSGMPEAYELKNLLKYVLSVIERFERSIVLPVELGDLIDKIDSALEELQGSGYEDGDLKSLPLDVPQDFFSYWNAVATAREDYRNSIAFNFSNKTRTIEASNLVQILTRWIKEVNTGLLRAIKIGSQGYGDDGSSGVTPTYFSYNITNWTLTGETNKDGYELVNATAMSVGTFPLFLEGPVRMMKTSTTSEEARIIYRNVLASGLRDDKLKMYSISASLEGQSFDMGRMMAFSPGWLENQSIWTHMSYKYYLELLRNGLYVEFFNEMRGGGMLPFMDPEVYGRSPMECSSFIASSAFPDPSRHGEGFLARLSGSTAEFLSVWVLMMVGPTPFFLEKKTKKLRMHLRPALPLWLFRRESGRDGGDLTIEFLLFGSINVTYHNPKQLDLFGVPPDRYVVTYSNETSTTIEESTIPTDIATDIRKVKPIKNIHAFF